MNHRKVERISCQVGVRKFQSSSLACALKCSVSPAAVLSRTDSSSLFDIQKSVTSKPLVGWGCMTNGWKVGKVAYVIGFQLRARICNTPRYELLKPFIKVLIKHQIKWPLPS
jgi:hypothetical protein